MIAVMEVSASEEQVEAVIERMLEMGFNPSRTTGQSQTLIAGVGHGAINLASFEAMPGVREAHRISSPYKLASRRWKPDGTQVRIAAAVAGARPPLLIARAAPAQVRALANAGVHGVAAAAAKARFGYEPVPANSLAELHRAARQHELFTVTEVIDPARISTLAPFADAFLVAAAHMENDALLRELGRQKLPVILERSLAATLDDWLMAAEAILAGGNGAVVLCERGIKTFDASGPAMDLAAIPAIHRLSHLPVIADPFRGTGKRDRALAMGRAALAAGADGLILEAGEGIEDLVADYLRFAAVLSAAS
jgi:3-deoxy-7-phosphoheptulonate synthase